MNSESFIQEIYDLKKNSSCIVTKEYILDKTNRIFFSGRWGSDLFVRNDINRNKDEIIFGLKSGIIFLLDNNIIKIFIIYDTPYGLGNSCYKLDNKLKDSDEFFEKNQIELTHNSLNYYFRNYSEVDRDPLYRIRISNEESMLINYIIEKWYSELKIFKENENIFKLKEENERIEKLNNLKKSIYSDLDKDGNGEVDLIDGESINKLLTKNQLKIIEIDKNYIQKFVKISLYLKTKKSNTQRIFDSIKDTKNDTELNELINLLKNQIHTYELLVFHSISMVTSLVESDLITFYEIYECFDQLGVFNSNWENEVSNKLTDIGDGIKDLMYSIYQMENKIVSSIDNLTYVTQDSFTELNMSVNKQLSSIDSSIKFNNLLTGIQTYQMYKINQNTKRIN
jgi:hypothetical protein